MESRAARAAVRASSCPGGRGPRSRGAKSPKNAFCVRRPRGPAGALRRSGKPVACVHAVGQSSPLARCSARDQGRRKIYFIHSEITDSHLAIIVLKALWDRLLLLERPVPRCVQATEKQHGLPLLRNAPAGPRGLRTQNVFFGDFAPRERGPRPPGQELARTAARAARLSVQLLGYRRPAPPASCVPHGRTALESRAIAAIRLVPSS